MPRSKNFEPSAAMGQVMDLFWHFGYSNTSFDQLVARTRASRYGLYSTFGGKDQLLLAALDRYTQDVVDPLVAPLEDPTASLPQIRLFLEGVLDLLEEKGARGCLNCNLSIEIGQARTVAGRRLRAHFLRLHGLVARALRNARNAGRLPPDFDEDEHAHFLIAVTAGTFLLARADMPPRMTTALIHAALTALEEPT